MENEVYVNWPATQNEWHLKIKYGLQHEDKCLNNTTLCFKSKTPYEWFQHKLSKNVKTGFLNDKTTKKQPKETTNENFDLGEGNEHMWDTKLTLLNYIVL